MIARLPPLLIWLVAAASAASVGLAAMPVVSRFTARDAAWLAKPLPLPGTAEASGQDLDPGRTDLAPILDFAPFGRSDLPEPQTIATSGTASALTLQGIALAVPLSASQAIIAGGQDDRASYRIGDNLAPGVSLQDIRADHVMLSIDGQSRRLDFPDSQTGADPAAHSNDPAAANSATYLQNLIPAATPPEPQTAAAVVARIRADLQRNPRAVLAQYGIEPTGSGYRITDATPTDLLRIGLMPGDLVTGLNGQPLGALQADQPLFDAAAASGIARLEVTRDGQSLSLSVPLQ